MLRSNDDILFSRVWLFGLTVYALMLVAYPFVTLITLKLRKELNWPFHSIAPLRPLAFWFAAILCTLMFVSHAFFDWP